VYLYIYYFSTVFYSFNNISVSFDGVVDMPRVPDGRVRVYKRVGLLSRGCGH